jgi:hypothetical protein
MTVRRTAGSLALIVFIVCSVAAARADQTYRVEGRDTYQIGTNDVRSEIAYHGQQSLSIVPDHGSRRYTARVLYERNDQGALAKVKASYESVVSPTGEPRDTANRDPDYLTILNQPFAVQLDAATMRDLARLHGSVPFDFASPITGAPLHGTLRHIPDGMINGVRVLGVAFDAGGPLRGTLPDHAAMALAGRIRMSGTAYYTYGDALLMALDATLAIDGNLKDAGRHDPVAIVYKRSIRATPPAPVNEARR